MEASLEKALSDYLLVLADNELIQGHRASEWCGHAPILEEDIAFANLALDEIGHARLWYTLVAELRTQDLEQYPDQLVYFRSPEEFRNIQLVELPNGDWAFSMLRQYALDMVEHVRLERLRQSFFSPLANTASKILKEERYHLRHSQAWVRRLGLGTEESHRRLQNALDEQWQYFAGLWVETPEEKELVAARLIPPAFEIRQTWLERVQPLLKDCELTVPGDPGFLSPDGGQHTSFLSVILSELQSLPRGEPEAEW